MFPISYKVRLMRSLAMSIFLYACETWTVTVGIERRVQALEMRCFRNLLSISYRLPTNIVFLTDCWSILHSLQSPGGDQISSNIRQELSLLKNKTSVTLQWIPSHCGVGGNEETDRLSNMGSKLCGNSA